MAGQAGDAMPSFLGGRDAVSRNSRKLRFTDWLSDGSLEASETGEEQIGRKFWLLLELQARNRKKGGFFLESCFVRWDCLCGGKLEMDTCREHRLPCKQLLR